MDLGQQLRVLSSPPLRCVIVDRKHAVIPGPGRNGDNGAYVLHGPHLVLPIVALFESLWVQAQPLVIEGKQSEVIVTEERMRQVSTLLSAGMKDEAVARRLSISVRTVRRVIAATMQTLHADSRWQAGALAARQGWDGTASKAHLSD